jgi:SAM-dependent methyltransferase
LVPDKRRAFAEAYRVLVPGGRVLVSDMILSADIPAEFRSSVAGYVACLSGAMLESDYLGAIAAAGFENIEVVERVPYLVDAEDEFVRGIAESVGVSVDEAIELSRRFASVRVSARKAAAA